MGTRCAEAALTRTPHKLSAADRHALSLGVSLAAPIRLPISESVTQSARRTFRCSALARLGPTKTLASHQERQPAITLPRARATTRPRPPPHRGLALDRRRRKPETSGRSSGPHLRVRRLRPIRPPLPPTRRRPDGSAPKGRSCLIPAYRRTHCHDLPNHR